MNDDPQEIEGSRAEGLEDTLLLLILATCLYRDSAASAAIGLLRVVSFLTGPRQQNNRSGVHPSIHGTTARGAS